MPSSLRSILASEGLHVEAAIDPGLKKALVAWKASLMWDYDQAKRKGKTVLVKRVKFTSASPDFSSLVDEINKKFFVGSGHKVQVVGPVEDVRNPPKQDYSEKNFSCQEYEIVPDSSSKTASSFNPASPFAKKLGDLLSELMQPGSHISVGSGKGEFSGKFGMRVTVVNPIEFEPTPFTSDNVEDEDEHKTKEFLVLLGKLEARLSQWFGLIAHTETTEESAITFTLELRGPN